MIVDVNGTQLAPVLDEAPVVWYRASEVMQAILPQWDAEASFVSLIERHAQVFTHSGHAQLRQIAGRSVWCVTLTGVWLTLIHADYLAKQEILQRFLQPMVAHAQSVLLNDTWVTAQVSDGAGERWFLGVEVLRALGSSNPASALSRALLRHEREIVLPGYARKIEYGRLMLWGLTSMGVFMLLVHSRYRYRPLILDRALCSVVASSKSR